MSVFHAYDIRGLSPQEIDEVFARRLARSLIIQFTPRRVLVGRDMRSTSPQLEVAFVEELTNYGVDVVRIGLCSTPLFYASVGMREQPVDLGIMVTASHNPGAYNGFKLVRGDVSPIGQGTGMGELESTYNLQPTTYNHLVKSGRIIEDPAALDRYLDRVFELARLPADMPKMKVAIDAGNGMAGYVLPALLRRCPWLEVLPLYFEPDGNFPHHEANPLKTDTLHDLTALVQREKCQLGIAFDGDADRIGFVDEAGVPMRGDFVTALLAQEILHNKPGGLVLIDLRSSWAAAETIREAGGEAKLCRVGHALIKPQMKKEQAIFAGEISMHYYFTDLFYSESGDLTMLLVLRRLAEARQALSELCKPLHRYAHSGEINFQVADKTAAISRIRQTYESKATSVSELDGIRMEFRDSTRPENDWWFNVRLSNTEPLLRLNLETRSPEMTQQKIAELTALITPS